MANKLLHDKILSSKTTLRLENRLRQEIQSYFNYTLIPSVKSRKNVNQSAFNNIITQYSNALYRLGASYTSKIANRELVSSEQDSNIKTDLVNYFTGLFWSKIAGLSAIQRVEPNLRPSQVISMEKDRLSSEMSALVAWKSFNAGIKSKGYELKNELKIADRNNWVGIYRKIWNKDFTGVNKQRIITDSKNNAERTSAVKNTEQRLKRGELDPNLADLFGEKFLIVWTFITMEDEKVCEICRGLETQQWQLDDPTVPDIPSDTHENCRCRLAFAEIIED